VAVSQYTFHAAASLAPKRVRTARRVALVGEKPVAVIVRSIPPQLVAASFCTSAMSNVAALPWIVIVPLGTDSRCS
jgi:hypothetical protein